MKGSPNEPSRTGEVIVAKSETSMTDPQKARRAMGTSGKKRTLKKDVL